MASRRIIHISDLHFTSTGERTAQPDLPGDINFEAILNPLNPIQLHPEDFLKWRSEIADPDRHTTLLNFLKTYRRALGTDVVVITGDLVDSGGINDVYGRNDQKLAKQFLHELKENQFNAYCVPGNHDYGWHGQLLLADEEYRRGFHAELLVECGPDLHDQQGIDKWPKVVRLESQRANDITWNGAVWLVLLDSLKGAMDDGGFGLMEVDISWSEGIHGDFLPPRQWDTLDFPQLGAGNINHTVARIVTKGIISPPIQLIIDTQFGQGKLGDHQIHELETKLQNKEQGFPGYESGDKIVVCLHHSPLDQQPNLCELEDKGKLVPVFKGKIDCLLFGHTGKPQEQHLTEQENWGVPIVNSENLEACWSVPTPKATSSPNSENWPFYKVSVIDLDRDRVEVWEVGKDGALGNPCINYGSGSTVLSRVEITGYEVLGAYDGGSKEDSGFIVRIHVCPTNFVFPPEHRCMIGTKGTFSSDTTKNYIEAVIPLVDAGGRVNTRGIAIITAEDEYKLDSATAKIDVERPGSSLRVEVVKFDPVIGRKRSHDDSGWMACVVATAEYLIQPSYTFEVLKPDGTPITPQFSCVDSIVLFLPLSGPSSITVKVTARDKFNFDSVTIDETMNIPVPSIRLETKYPKFEDIPKSFRIPKEISIKNGPNGTLIVTQSFATGHTLPIEIMDVEIDAYPENFLGGLDYKWTAVGGSGTVIPTHTSGNVFSGPSGPHYPPGPRIPGGVPNVRVVDLKRKDNGAIPGKAIFEVMNSLDSATVTVDVIENDLSPGRSLSASCDLLPIPPHVVVIPRVDAEPLASVIPEHRAEPIQARVNPADLYANFGAVKVRVGDHINEVLIDGMTCRGIVR